ncbi:hypothetical protein Patl1_22371 [Pistacia atlantica]|uniref:Uncharacterized protein n=1 Tax=Pistacia atlantica TaxID=434234 RepID=A0ACC0ZXM5_9ROSI|nr:hypothetical protein Patl1_22371 [Pistacia atlantica]
MCAWLYCIVAFELCVCLLSRDREGAEFHQFMTFMSTEIYMSWWLVLYAFMGCIFVE